MTITENIALTIARENLLRYEMRVNALTEARALFHHSLPYNDVTTRTLQLLDARIGEATLLYNAYLAEFTKQKALATQE